MATQEQMDINGLFYTVAQTTPDYSQVTGITVGNVTATGNLSTTGKFSISSVSNLSIGGGSSGQVLATNGSGTVYWATPGTTTAGTVTSITTGGSGLGFSLTGGPITTSGTVTLATPSVTTLRTNLSIGNIANINLDGNVSNILLGDGSWAAKPTSGSGTVTSVNAAGSGLGFSLSGSITTSGTITLNTPTSSALISSMGLGNITSINVNGDTTKYLRGDGTWQTVASSGGTTLPSQTSNSGKVLSTDGTNLSWISSSGVGTVTSVTGTGSGLGFALSGTVTTSGSVTLSTPTATGLKTSLGIGNVSAMDFNGSTTQYLRGDGTWQTVSGGTGSTSNVPNLTGTTTQYLRGDGWATLPVGTVAQLNLPNDAALYLNGVGQWTAPTAITSVVSGNNIKVTTTSGAATVSLDTIKYAKEAISLNSVPSASFNVDIKAGSIYYNTGTTTSNVAVNIRGDTSTTFNSLISVGETITVTIMLTNKTTAYGISSFSIDGVAYAVKMLNGTDLTGDLNCISSYTINIIKTATTPTYTIIGNKAKYV